MKLIAVLNEKGGAAKTTTAVNLAAIAHLRGHRVALVDSDPQQSAMTWQAQGGGWPFMAKPVLFEKTARKFRDDVRAAVGDVDLCFIDCPPALADAARVASLIADLVLIPCGASSLDLWAAENAVDLVKDARETKGTKEPLCAFVPSKVKNGTALSREVRDALGQHGEPVAPSIVDRVAVAEAVTVGVPVAMYQPNGLARREFETLFDFLEALN